MAKYSSTSAVFLVDGYNFLAAKLKTLNLKIMQMTEETDGLGDASQAFSPTGKQQGTITQGGAFWDTSALNIHAAMATKLGATPQDTARVMTVGCMGNTVGAVIYGIAGAFSVAYEAAVALGKLTKANAEHLLAGLIDRGAIVQPLAAQTANWNTHTLSTPVDFTLDPSQFLTPITSNTLANPTVVTCPVPHGLTTGQVIFIAGNITSSPAINGQQTATVISALTFSVPVNCTTGGTGGTFVLGSTVNGGAGYQQVTAFTGFTGYVGKIRHSVDETTYADLSVFVNVTSGPNGQCITVAPGTTVNRYVCHDGVVTGSGSLTVLSAFCRR